MKRYPAYKDSGIEWIGKIPVHWQKRRVKSVMDYIVNGIWGEDPVGDKNDIVCVRVADFDMSKLGISKENLTQRNINMSQQNNRMLSQNDILIEKSGGGEKQTVGRVISIDIDAKAVCSNFVGKIAIKSDEIIPRFGTYLFFSMYAIGLNQKAIKQTTGIQNLDTDNYFNEYFYTPSFEEQTAITDYLDQKTAQIDDLIAKKERMIELLKEERAAIINQAVTKGIDPRVEMKDSGIEWLGKVPKQWEVKRLKYILSNKKGSLKTGPFGSQLKQSDMQGSDVKVYNQRSVIDNDFDSNDLYISIEKFAELMEFEIFPDDILLTTRGTIGKCAIFPRNKDKGILHPCLIRIQLNQNIISNKFSRYFIQDAQSFYESVKYNSNATTIDVIYGETLRDVIFVVPDRGEQDRIIDFLDRKTAQIDAQVTREQKSIELLQEYRTALISEVVTGKIDVRG